MTLFEVLFGLLVLEMFFKDGRFNLGFGLLTGLLTLQPGYLVSQFLNLFLLDPDNLHKSRHQRCKLLLANLGNLWGGFNAPL